MRARVHGRVGYWILRERKEIERIHTRKSFASPDRDKADRQTDRSCGVWQVEVMG